MAGITTTAADAARSTAFRTLFQALLLNGTAGGVIIASPTPGASPSSLGITLDMWDMAMLAYAKVTGPDNPNPPLAGNVPKQLPVFANGAALPAAATWPGGFALVTSLGTAGQPVYSDGANWRRADTNSTTIP